MLDRDFQTEDSIAPRETSRFHDGAIQDNRVADAHGAVRDFLHTWPSAASSGRAAWASADATALPGFDVAAIRHFCDRGGPPHALHQVRL